MGYNTTVVIYNDGLNGIENDKAFGRKLVEAIRKNWDTGKAETILVPYSAGQVIEQHHSSIGILIKVGGNTGVIVEKTKTN